MKVTEPTRLGMPDREHVVPTHVAASTPKTPVRPSGPLTIAVHVLPWLVDWPLSESVGIVVVVEVVDVVEVVEVVVLVDVVVELVVVVDPSDDTTNPRSSVARAEVLAALNRVEADVPCSLGPAMPDWKVYPHEFTEKMGPTPVVSFIG